MLKSTGPLLNDDRLSFTFRRLDAAAAIDMVQAGIERPFCDTVTDVPVSECEALVALYTSTRGTDWRWTYPFPPETLPSDGWLENTAVCSWTGVYCIGDPTQENVSRVWRLVLSASNSNGPIPPELGNLPFMDYLDLSANNLVGTLPVELSQLSNLQTIYLYSNRLTSPLPDLSSLSQLSILELGYNLFAEPLPEWIAGLQNLTWLALYGNQFTGSISASYGQLANLRDLLLFANPLSGPLPDELA